MLIRLNKLGVKILSEEKGVPSVFRPVGLEESLFSFERVPNDRNLRIRLKPGSNDFKNFKELFDKTIAEGGSLKVAVEGTGKAGENESFVNDSGEIIESSVLGKQINPETTATGLGKKNESNMKKSCIIYGQAKNGKDLVLGVKSCGEKKNIEKIMTESLLKKGEAAFIFSALPEV